MKRTTIYSRFHEWVIKTPDATAILEDGRNFSFLELDRLADGILSKFPSEPHKYIGIVMSHGTGMIAAMLAVLKSGAAYIPAEPMLPKERIDYMMDSAPVDFVITDDFCKDIKPSDRNFPDLSAPESPAYILYTSGTTGRPKGVVVANSCVVNYAEAFEEEFHIGPGDVMLQYSVCSFDIFVEEVFATLLNGAALAIPDRSIIKSGIGDVMRFVERHKVTAISGFPYLLAEMNRLPELPKSLRLLISGGDVLRASYISNLRNKGILIYNTYGPSETTVCASYYRCDNAEALPDGTFPVGKEVKGVEIRILDNRMREMPDGKTGEICILGEGVSLGYLGNPPERKNFVLLTDGRRMYRSGDMGYRLPDGNIAFLGRRDDQVMILGKRVELGEVENVLITCPEVENGVVCAYNDNNGLAYLVAYFIPKSGRSILPRIKEWLASKLTDFMIPEYFVRMESIPLTPRGKVDYAALPKVIKEGVA